MFLYEVTRMKINQCVIKKAAMWKFYFFNLIVTWIFLADIFASFALSLS